MFDVCLINPLDFIHDVIFINTIYHEKIWKKNISGKYTFMTF